VNAINPAEIKFGLDTFGGMNVKLDGTPETAAQVIRDIVEQAKLADELGLSNFNVGEHHRDDFAVSAPDTVLAGIATVTKNITLGTGVTVLSSEDPVRVFQRFATLDALSNGRAEITAGRGSFTESFPLFGYELGDYNVLFEEKLELLVELFKEGPVTWNGTTRKPLKNQEIYPKTESGAMKMRVGVGGSPESVIRAARLGIPMALAIIGGDPARFGPYANLYHEALEKFGQKTLPISIHSPGHVAATDDEARNWSGRTTKSSSVA
jgi:alkanesulfonate monooxygenase SsuD/methylene tetrahydromethanopterin reductase-like flavin-dependent oxidoreductase (luciferase family)